MTKILNVYSETLSFELNDFTKDYILAASISTARTSNYFLNSFNEKKDTFKLKFIDATSFKEIEFLFDSNNLEVTLSIDNNHELPITDILNEFADSYEQLLISLEDEIVEEEISNFYQEIGKEKQEETIGIIDLLIPNEKVFITPILFYINAFVFVLMYLSQGSIEFSTSTILDFGGNFTPLTLTDEPWRLLTCNFVHLNLIHVLSNMIALIYLGGHLEQLFNRYIYLLIYISTGLFSSLAGTYLNDPLVISAGASGSIFGILGFLLILSIDKNHSKKVKQVFKGALIQFLAYNIFFSFRDGVDYWGHFGGLFGGLFFGTITLIMINNNVNLKLVKLSLVTLILITSTGLYFLKDTSDVEYLTQTDELAADYINYLTKTNTLYSKYRYVMDNTDFNSENSEYDFKHIIEYEIKPLIKENKDNISRIRKTKLPIDYNEAVNEMESEILNDEIFLKSLILFQNSNYRDKTQLSTLDSLYDWKFNDDK